VRIQASATWTHDDNLIRLPPDSATDPAKKADTTRTLGAGLKFENVIGRQRLIADLNLNQSAYARNTNLDFLGGEGRLAWLWQVGNYGSGEAGYRKRRALGGFEDFQQNVQDLIDADTYTLTGGYQFHPRWRIAAELTEEESVHSAPVRQTLDVYATSAGVNLTYRTPGDDSIGLQARRTDRSYPNRAVVGFGTVDNGHRETRLNAITAWRFSGKLKLDAQVGHADVRHALLSVRDFSGATWRAAATWDPTGKLRLSLNGSKDVRLYEDLATNYTVVKSVGLSPIYAATPKIMLRGDFNFEKRDYRGDPGFLLAPAPAREDDTRLARVSVSYSPIRNLDLSVSYEAGDRQSNVPLNGFEYRSWSGTVRASF
jgi:exopolysaccharide biosynthesis operon protein EpsL